MTYIIPPLPQHYCPYHFNCTGCGNELTSSAREVKTRPGYTAQELNELYCLRCHDRMGIPICGACRRPIEVGGYRAIPAVGVMGSNCPFQTFYCELSIKNVQFL